MQKSGPTEPVSPGDTFNFTFVASCSGLQFSCIDAVLEDPIPPDLVVAVVPPSTDTYQVAVIGPPGAQTLRVTFTIPLQAPNPPGSVGLPDGSALNLVLPVLLPPESQVLDGSSITNTATISATGSDPVIDSATVAVDVPKDVTPVATKAWSDGAAVAGTGETGTIRLGVRNASSSSAAITDLRVEDVTPAVFEHFDVTGLGAVTFPAGADRVVVLTCTNLLSACDADADWTASAPQTGTPLAFPPGVDPAAVTGVRFVFSNSTGLTLPYDPTGGSVEVTTVLRDTVRSTAAPYEPTVTENIRNCADPSATEAVDGLSAGVEACSTYTVFPAQATVSVAKSFFPDANANFTAEAQGTDGRAVLGQVSPVSAVTTARNTSPFALSSLTVREPSATSISEFSKVDVESVRAVFPTGATAATVAIDCGSGPVTTPLTATGNVPSPCLQPISIVITYTGTDVNGNGTIAEATTGSLGVHGTLSSRADLTDATNGPGASGDGVSNCADVAASSSIDGVGSAAASTCGTLPVWVAYSQVRGVKSAQLPSILPGLPRLFTLAFTNSGTIAASNVVMADPVDPTAPGNPFDSTRLADLTLPPSPPNPPATAEVWDPTVSGYVPYVAGDADLLARSRGFRVTVPSVAAGATYTLQFNVLLRDGVPAGTTFANCAGITTGTETAPGFCSQQITVGEITSGAALQKALAPATSVRPEPGLPGQPVQLKLALQNTGTLFLKQLQATDAAAAFYDAVDLTGAVQRQLPARLRPGAHRCVHGRMR